jgi:hypothetical protein
MWMKNSRQRSVLLLMVSLLLLCGITTLVETRFKVIRRGYDDFILDNRNHYLPCEALPARVHVETLAEQHRDVVQQIEDVAPGFVGVELDSGSCQGKADLLIWYGTHEQRLAIEKIIGGDTFFGIPYRLQNR